VSVTPSNQQAAIWHSFAADQHHVIVVARAGTGKSFTILNGIGKLPRGLSVAIVAFNKSIADELKAKLTTMGVSATACTMHSLGFQAVTQSCGPRKPNQWKTRDLVDKLAPGTAITIKQPVEKLVSLCKANVISGDDSDLLDTLAWQHGLNLNDDANKAFDLVPKVVAASMTTDVIDFDDMIWLPVVLGLPLRRYDVLMVDEAQDLNQCQQQLAMRAIESGAGKPSVVIGGRTIASASEQGRLVLVGDPMQAIYGFRGADTVSMGRMASTLANTPRGCQEYPLTVTRRCPKAVVRLAQQLVPDFEALPDAPEGLVMVNGDACPDHRDDSGHVRVATCPKCAALPSTTPVKGDMVLCRTNAPLVEMAYSLIRADMPCRIQGRDIGQGLKALIGKLVKGDGPTTLLLERLVEWNTKETAIIQAKLGHNADVKYQALSDKVECIEALCEGQSTVAGVLSRIDTLFQDVTPGDHSAYVLLSSVHRAKGLESKVVRILRPELMPHPMAKQPWEQEQERNILYVAITRSLDVLIFHGQPTIRLEGSN
jgi:DNA helicase II / ATP-dependent DNA helicase PcrA